MSIFQVKGGKLAPIAIIKNGKTVTFDEFMAQANSAPAPADAPKGDAGKDAPAVEPAKDAPKAAAAPDAAKK